MTILIKKELKSAKWKYVIFFALLIIMAITIIIQYPFVKNLLEQGILEGMPQWMVKGASQQTDFNVYLSSNWFDKNLLQLSVIFSILLGMSVIATEVEDHTIEFLLTRPFSRERIFFEKTGIQLATGLIIMILTTFVLGIISLFQGYEVDLIRLFIGIIPLFAKFFIIYSLALLVSLFFDDQVKAGISTGVILFLLWGVNFIWDLAFVNIFSYAPVTPFYLHGIFPWSAILKLYLLAFVLYSLSLYKFKNKDF